MRLKQGIAIAGTHGKTTTTSLVTSVLAEAGLDPDLRDRRPPQRRRRQLAPRRGRLHRRRGRRVRRVVPEPAAGDGGRHQHRRRPHGHLRPRLRAAEAGVRRVHPQDAVLRRGDPVRRRPRRALDHADDLAPGRHLRLRRRRDGARRQRRGARRRRCASPCSAGTACRMPDLQVTLNLPGDHNVLNALAAIAVATELELADAPVVKGAGRVQRRRPPLPALRRAAGRGRRRHASR